jgi:methyltransferase family protein
MGDELPRADGINYQRLYEYRFRNVDQASRDAVWREIARFLSHELGNPDRVLDPGAGRREFINALTASERWTIDAVAYEGVQDDPSVHAIIGDARSVELPSDYFDGVLVSNLLEHFTTQEDIGGFLARMRVAMRLGGRIALLGPNFRYCPDEYFDCADHTLALTHVAIAEHLYAAGFDVARVVPRFLPYSFRSRLPSGGLLVRAYLKMPIAWRVLGKQYLVIGERPRDD